MNTTLKGLLLATIASLCWGSMGVAAQYLMEQCQFTVMDLTSIRLLGAGLVLVCLDLLFHKTRNIRGVFTVRNFKDIVIYGALVLASQATFFLSIRYANAATATIIVLTSPLFIIAWLAIAHHRRIKPIELISLALAMCGVVLLITKGSLKAVDFSILGVAWGLLNAMTSAAATLQPARVVRELTVFPVIGWAMTISGAVACLFNNPFESNIIWNTASIACYLHVVLCGTVVSFCCYLKSMHFISPAKASMLLCFEPLSAAVLSVAFLGTRFGAMEALGALFIFATVILLARTKN